MMTTKLETKVRDAHDEALLIFKLMDRLRPVFAELTPEMKPVSLNIGRVNGDDMVLSILLTPKP